MAPHHVSDDDSSDYDSEFDSVDASDSEPQLDLALEIESDTDSDVQAEAPNESQATIKSLSKKQQNSQILLAYHQLSSRRVDLVGDYAGNELFLVEGDSLLLHCFSNADLDFDNGFQLVHAVYLVENFLHHLRQRKCNFHIAFFAGHKALCMPDGVAKHNLPKYLLARSVVIRHLQSHMPDAAMRIRTFDSVHSETFEHYLATTAVYFMMCHDGAQPHTQKNKMSFRIMILTFIARGYNVALVNGLEWRDTKVMTMVLERSRKTPQFSISAAAAKSMSDSGSQERKLFAKHEEAIKALVEEEKYTERELLAVATLSILLTAKDSPTSTQADLHLSALSFLIHVVLLKHLPMSSRRLGAVDTADDGKQFLFQYCLVAESIMRSEQWVTLMVGCSTGIDVADAVDGRLLNVVASGLGELPKDVQDDVLLLVGAVKKVIGIELPTDLPSKYGQESSVTPPEESPGSKISVMPFSNPVFDKHLKSIHLIIDERAENQNSSASARIFREVSHWHNAKRPLVSKGAPIPVSAKEQFWIDRRNQWFMAEMRDYASSLTNSVGKSLDPETIVVGAVRPSTPASAMSSGRESPVPSDVDTKSGKNKTPDTKKKGGKVAAKNAGKQAMLDNIAAANAKKEEAGTAKLVQAWHFTCKNIYADQNLSTRYNLLKDYFKSLSRDKAKVLAAEVQLCMLSILLEQWIEITRTAETKDLGVAALIWHTCRAVLACTGLTKVIIANVDTTILTLGLPSLSLPEATTTRALPFTFPLPAAAKHTLSVNMSSKDFQLLHCGPYLDRSIDSAPDPRVEFEPDLWQRKVLDGIDADKSLLVVAPTSAGKTFISFYAMRKVLEADDDSVLVYVAPTKALVNQIAAEIQARYSKKFKYPGKSVWAIHTRDYRINNSSGCQILVTVPHVLQIMLLAPSHANSWSTRVKRIIFDEVHSIGNADDGVVWEQLLLLAPCPIIALSATVGNPLEFNDWLSSTQAAIGNEVVMEGTTQRYSDLRKFNYLPPKQFAFSGLPERASFKGLGLDGTAGFAFVHPVASLINKSRGMPEDLSLEPRDCFTLWSAMVKHQTKEFPVPEHLNPITKALPQLVGKKNTIPWERELKEVLKGWMLDEKSPFDLVLNELGTSFHDVARPEVQNSPATLAVGTKSVTVHSTHLEETTLPLLCSLHEQDALPAILFNYDRGACESISMKLVEQLQEAETAWKESSPKWKAKLKAWEERKIVQEKLAAKKGKGAKASSKKMGKDDREDAEGDRTSKLDQQRDAGEIGYSEFDSFDPEAPVDGFHFADPRKLQVSEMDTYVRQLRRKHIAEWLISAISRGVGVRHAGMNRKYRQVVEILFRKGYLRVIVATGTLALGINMPCKTVVFSGDSVFLTALTFRQGAGRAGRRGFDLLSNVVFQGITEAKICRLLSSRLPDLNGHFPVTTTLTLRLFSLLHESKNSPYAIKAINSLLSRPRLYMGGPAFKDQTLHHLRFSIEYLRRQRLLDARGATLNFAGLVSHLYYTENSSFAFHALLKEGYFHKLCANVNKGERNTVDTLMLVMSHLFGRVFCRQADEEYRKKVVKPSSSIVFLPNLPADASKVLREHADDTLQVFRAYVSTFVDQHVHDADDQLPLTHVKVGAKETPIKAKQVQEVADDLADEWDAEDDDSTESTGLDLPALTKQTLPPTKVRSQFVSPSGRSDNFTSISDLCKTTRSGVFLEQSVIPHVGSYPDELESPLNAYLLDFYEHGDVKTLATANRIRAGEVWFLLNDFSMILATIITSLMNFMKLKPSSDLDMLEVMGNLDALEEAEDDKLAASETDSAATPVVSDPMKAPEKPIVLKKKGKKLDSWEDEEEEEEDEGPALADRSRGGGGGGAEADDWDDAAWEGEVGEKGLLQVLKAFQLLHKDFNEKFRAMWA